MYSFIIDDTIESKTDLGLHITEQPVIPSAQRIVDTITVDGREGTLSILKGWDDLIFTMKVAIRSRNARTMWREVLPRLLEADTIHFSNDAGVCYHVKHIKAGALEMRLSMLGEAQLEFVCEPFRYMRGVAPITLSATGKVINPGTVYSLPRLTIYGTGTRTLTINGKPIVLNILQGSLTLDSALMECHFGGVAQNNRMSGDFPRLDVGENSISLASGITKVEIEPRWRFL
jgi:phage-related protein